MTAAFIVVKTGRDALYLQGRGLVQLPWTYVAIAVMAGPVSMAVLGAMRRFGPRRVRVVLPVLTAALLVLYFPWAEPGGGILPSLFFAFVPLVWGVMFSTAWLLGGDLLEGSPRAVVARGYARIGAASIAGGAGGGLLARLVTSLCTPADLLLFGAGLLVLSVAVMAWIQAAHPRSGDDGSRVSASAEPPLSRPLPTHRGYLRSMFAIAVLTGLVGVLVELQFYLAAGTSASVEGDRLRFFSNFYTALGLVALALQLWAVPRLQVRAGVEGSLFVLPAGLMLGSSVLVLGAGSLLARASLRLTEGGLKKSIHRSNWEQAYLSLPRGRRPTSKVVVDGMGERLGEALAAIALLAWIHLLADGSPAEIGVPLWISWALLGGTLAWIVSTVLLRRARPAPDPLSTPEETELSVPLPDS